MILHGLEVVVDENISLFAKKTWIYPTERFWSYEPSPETERWCRFFGFGHEKIEYPAYQMGNKLIVHPVTYKTLTKQAQTN